MSNVKIIPLEEPPKRKYRKSSTYDTIIDKFIESGHNIARIELTKKDGTLLEGTYLTGQLKKRLKIRTEDPDEKNEEVKNVTAKTINKQPYLEKIDRGE